MSKELSRFDWLPPVLLVLTVVITWASDLYQGAMLLGGLALATLCVLMYVLDYRNGVRCLVSLSHLVSTALIFYFAVSTDSFLIFERNYLVVALVFLPVVFIVLGFIGRYGSVGQRMRQNMTYMVSILAAAYGHFIFVAIASSGV